MYLDISLLNNPSADIRIEVITAQNTAICGLHIVVAEAAVNYRHIKSATTKVIHQGQCLAAFRGIDGSCGRLIDKPHYRQAGQLCSLDGCMALVIGKVGRYGNHHILYILTALLHQLPQHPRRCRHGELPLLGHRDVTLERPGR